MKPTYKNIKEIKSIFEIDISEKNRKSHYVAFRSFYAEQLANYLPGNDRQKFIKIALELNMKRISVYHLIKNAESFRNNKSTRILYKAFSLKNKKYLDKFFEEKRKIHTEYSKISKAKEIIENHVDFPRQKCVVNNFNKNNAALSNLQLSEYLRLNKVFNHICWGVNVRNISQNQWEDLRRINKEMFDRYTSKI